MYRKIVNMAGRHTRMLVAIFYVVLLLRFVWSCLRETTGGCAVVECVCFWLTGILALMIFVSAMFLLFIDHMRLDRILSGGKLSNILFIIAGIVSVPLVFNFLLSLIYHGSGFAGEMFSETDSNTRTSLLWSIFYHFIDPGNQHMAVTQRARMWTLVISMAGAVLMGGVLISYLTNLFDRRGANFMEGLCRYRYNSMTKPAFGKFVIIIGGHDMAVGLCDDILARHDVDHVFVLTSSDVEVLRGKLRSKLKEKEERIVIYYGYRGNDEELDALYPQHAEEIYILGESGDEASHDQLNMKCVNYLASVIPAVPNPKKCYVLFEYQSTFAAFQSSSIRGIIDGSIEFVPFNYYETWAQKVVNEYLPIEGTQGQPYDSDRHVHLFVVGMSRMGVALAMEYAHAAHFPNFVRDGRLRTRITFIDADAERESAFLMGRYRNLFDMSRWRYADANSPDPAWHVPDRDFLDIEWEFMEGGVQTPFIRKYIEKQVGDANAMITMAVCMPDSSQSLASALYLPECMYDAGNVVQILVYQTDEAAIVNGINGSNDMKYHKLTAFGAAKDTYGTAIIVRDRKPAYVGGVYGVMYGLVESAASMDNVYEAIRRSYVAQGLKEWTDSKIWEKWSNIYNACSMSVKLRSCGISSEEFALLKRNVSMLAGRLVFNVDVIGVELMKKFRTLANVEHNRWNIEKLLMGYRVLTDEERGMFDEAMPHAEFESLKKRLKDGIGRAHLDIMPFDELVRVDDGVEDYDYVLSLMIWDILNED